MYDVSFGIGVDSVQMDGTSLVVEEDGVLVQRINGEEFTGENVCVETVVGSRYY